MPGGAELATNGVCEAYFLVAGDLGGQQVEERLAVAAMSASAWARAASRSRGS